MKSRLDAAWDAKKQKIMTHPDVLGAGAAKRRAAHLSPEKKIDVVMSEFSRGTLRSGSGEHVTNPKQAYAIAMSEAKRRSR